MIKTIRNIIFDLGGVLFNLDYERTLSGFKKAGVENIEKIFTQREQALLFSDFETGKITVENFFDGVRKLTGIPLANEQILSSWNAMLLDFPAERLLLLAELKKNFRLFLLSNTNELHIKAVLSQLDKQFGQNVLQKYFEDIFYSHEIGLRKPDREVFLFVSRKHSLRVEETLFIDDSIQHVEGAKQAGLVAAHLRKGEDIRNLLVKLRVLT